MDVEKNYNCKIEVVPLTQNDSRISFGASCFYKIEVAAGKAREKRMQIFYNKNEKDAYQKWHHLVFELFNLQQIKDQLIATQKFLPNKKPTKKQIKACAKFLEIVEFRTCLKTNHLFKKCQKSWPNCPTENYLCEENIAKHLDAQEKGGHTQTAISNLEKRFYG